MLTDRAADDRRTNANFTLHTLQCCQHGGQKALEDMFILKIDNSLKLCYFTIRLLVISLQHQ